MKRWLQRMRLAQGRKPEVSGAGYTITEVMVVLAVSTLLFVSVVMMFTGRQGRVEFTEAVRNYESNLQTIMSEVANGFSATTDNGASGNRIFLGKMLEHHGRTSEITTLIGKRTNTASGGGPVGNDVASLAEAMLERAGTPTVYNHRFQLEVVRVVRANAIDDSAPYVAFGFLNQVNGGSDVAGGSRLVKLYAWGDLTAPNALANPQPIPEGLKICVVGQNGQRAEIKIGENNSATTIFSELDTANTGACSV